MSAFVDPSAHCETGSLGAGSRVLAHAHVGPEVSLGRRCVIHDHAVLIGAVALEDGVEVHAGAQLVGRVLLEQGVSVGAGAVIGGEDATRGAGEIVVHRFTSIGPNATLLPGIAVGRRAVVEGGSVVAESVPANAIVSGNPARIVAYVDAGQQADAGDVFVPSESGRRTTETRVRGVTLHRLTHARDLRGSLTAAEFPDLPFVPQRLFAVFAIPSESVRGAHAHRACSQFLICLAGSLSCLVDDGSARQEIALASPSIGLHIPPMIWATQWKYTRDAVLLALASHSYDAADYIRDYEEFLEALGQDR